MLEKQVFDYTHEPVYHQILDNGLHLYLYPKEDFAEMSALLEVRFGSLDAPATKENEAPVNKAGLAHFLEHKLFELADGKDAALEFAKLSADSNAFTSYEKTAYYFPSHGENLEALDLLQEFIMTADFDQDSVEAEKAIIKQEVDMYLDDVDYKLYNGILSNLYPETPLAEDIAGSQESLANITLKDLKDSHRTYYTPSNMSLFVVGNFDKELVSQRIQEKQKKFTSHKHNIDRKRINLTEVVKKASIQREVAKPKLAMGIRLAPLSEGSLVSQKLKLRFFFSMILGWTSQNYQTYYDQGIIDDSFDIDIEVSRRYQFVIISSDTLEPINLGNQLERAIRQFKTNPDLNEEHLNTLKREYYGEFIRSLDSVEHLMTQLAAYQTDEESYLQVPTYLTKLTLEDVIETGQLVLDQMALSEMTVFPD